MIGYGVNHQFIWIWILFFVNACLKEDIIVVFLGTFQISEEVSQLRTAPARPIVGYSRDIYGTTAVFFRV